MKTVAEHTDRARLEILAEQYRFEAATCREMAEEASSQELREGWLKLAGQYAMLADEAEDQLRRH